MVSRDISYMVYHISPVQKKKKRPLLGVAMTTVIFFTLKKNTGDILSKSRYMKLQKRGENFGIRRLFLSCSGFDPIY